MTFKCNFCNRKGDLKWIDDPSSKFKLSRWHRDEKGYNHEIIICDECGNIHDVQFSFIKLLFSWALGNPYKINGDFPLLNSAKMIGDKSQELNVNPRSVAFYEFGLNSNVIDYMIKKGFFGKAFEEGIVTQREYLEKRNYSS